MLTVNRKRRLFGHQNAVNLDVIQLPSQHRPLKSHIHREEVAMAAGTTRLNEEQERAATSINGGLLVLAPVGTGKTTVLTQRVTNALRGGIPASAILCLSFTNKAANEVRERVRRALPKGGL
jgi:hypothetical protein